MCVCVYVQFIFKYFFVLYLLVILFGVLNGLLLLPTLLAYVGPPSIHAEDVTRMAGTSRAPAGAPQYGI